MVYHGRTLPTGSTTPYCEAEKDRVGKDVSQSMSESMSGYSGDMDTAFNASKGDLCGGEC